MLIRSNNKMDCIRAFINLWLKDPTWYCNCCGRKYGAEQPKPPFTCCEEPQVGRNVDHTRGVIKQNEETRKTRKNVYGATDKMNMRMGVSMPPALLSDLEKYFRTHYDEKWSYVRMNPVRRGLAYASEEWPFQGEVFPLAWR